MNNAMIKRTHLSYHCPPCVERGCDKISDKTAPAALVYYSAAAVVVTDGVPASNAKTRGFSRGSFLLNNTQRGSEAFKCSRHSYDDVIRRLRPRLDSFSDDDCPLAFSTFSTTLAPPAVPPRACRG